MKFIILTFFCVISWAVSAQDPGVASVDNAVTLESAFKIFPNPAKGSVNVSLKFPTIYNASIGVYDMLGNQSMLIVENFSGVFEKNIDISALRSGIYFIRLSNNNDKSILVKKLIVQ